MDFPLQELIDVLCTRALSMQCQLSLENVTRVAVVELSMSVREFWANYKLYLIGAFGNNVGHLETFQGTKMGKIVDAYARLYGKKVLYEALVRDVLMGLEEYYLEEYGKDVSNLRSLISEFEDKTTFEKDKNGMMLLELSQKEEHGKELQVLTEWMNDDSSPLHDENSSEEIKEEFQHHYECREECVFEQGESSNVSMASEERSLRLKERAKKLRRLRREGKPDIGEDGKKTVETNQYNIPDGKGCRELVYFLTVRTVSTCPTGIFESRKIAHTTIDRIIGEARKEFAGDWTHQWAVQSVRATLRQRKAIIVKQLKNPTDTRDLQSCLTTTRFTVAEKLAKNPLFVEKSHRMKATRRKVQHITHSGRGGFTHITHSGRGGFTHIRMRYFQEHQEHPNPQKVREIADTIAEKKVDVE